jgi:predicted 3-demethylubiquinone-9 3-methyltransferase (glyoxalase superfamily)
MEADVRNAGRRSSSRYSHMKTKITQKITPFLWFNDNAEEAANLYVSLFANSKILKVARYGEAGPGPSGSVMTVKFALAGQEFVALNGGPYFTLTEAFSLVVNCQTQAEIDELWEKLSAHGGEKSRCGWVKDKFGLSWQIVPAVLEDLVTDDNPERSQRVMGAMLKMDKLDLATLQQAYEGR